MGEYLDGQKFIELIKGDVVVETRTCMRMRGVVREGGGGGGGGGVPIGMYIAA